MEFIQWQQVRKIQLIIGYLLLLFASIIIFETSKAGGYEISIYAAFPLSFWFCFIISLGIGFLTIFQELILKRRTKLWIYGFLIVFFGNFLFLFLPLFRGYCFAGGANTDLFSHVGFIREIIQTGHFSSMNFYPSIHIMSYVSSGLLNFSFIETLWFFPVFFSMLYTIGMVLLAFVFSEKRKQFLLISLLSLILIFDGFHFSFQPSFFSFILLPVLMYLYQKRRFFHGKIEMTVLIVVMSFFIVFFHPMTTIFAIIIFLIFYLAEVILKLLKPYLHNYVDVITWDKTTNIVIILVVAFATWYTSFGEGLSDIKTIIQLLLNKPEWEITKEFIMPLINAQLSTVQTVQLFILRYGTILIYGFISLLGFLYVIKKFIFSREIKELEFSYSLELVVLFIIGLGMMTGYFLVNDPIRILRYFLMIATVFNGIVLYLIFRRNIAANIHSIRHSILVVLSIILILFSSFVCIGNVYPSPMIWQPNYEFTYMNYAGSEWMVNYRDLNVPIGQDVGSNILRMEYYFYGVEEGNMRMFFPQRGIPAHFGYNSNISLESYYNYNDTYMVITENGKQAFKAFPSSVQEMVHQYSLSDFDLLNRNTIVDKLYENGEVECWLLNI